MEKKYILKYNVHNRIDFPHGVIVKVNDPKWEFEVVEGELQGEKGHIADGLEGWLIDDTPENRSLLENINDKLRALEASAKLLNDEWEKVPAANLTNPSNK